MKYCTILRAMQINYVLVSLVTCNVITMRIIG